MQFEQNQYQNNFYSKNLYQIVKVLTWVCYKSSRPPPSLPPDPPGRGYQEPKIIKIKIQKNEKEPF